MTQNFAEYRNDDTRTEDVDSQISIIEGLMTVLTYSLFLSFAVVGIKKAFVKARSLDAAEIGAKIKNLRPFRKMKPRDEAAEFEARAAAEIELSKRRSNLSSVQSEEEAAPSSNSNPMLSGDEPGAASTTITQQASVTIV